MSYIPNIKYKSEMCNYWKEGKQCEKGHGCFFAHGESELQTIQQNHQAMIEQSIFYQQPLPSQLNYKTIYCKFYADGKCKLGQKCTYAHDKREKRKKKNEPPQTLMKNPHQQYNFQWSNYMPHPNIQYDYQPYYEGVQEKIEFQEAKEKVEINEQIYIHKDSVQQKDKGVKQLENQLNQLNIAQSPDECRKELSSTKNTETQQKM